MNAIRVYFHFLLLSLKRLCRQLLLPAVLVAACVTLPFGLSAAAGQALTEQVEFSGITLAVTGEKGDTTPVLLETYMSKMADIRQYCTVKAMERSDAEAALQKGDVTAILALPDNFISSVMTGRNDPITVIVDSSQPLEAALTLWVGQSAADILSAVQAGIYAVLDIYDAQRPAGLSRQDVTIDINMEYVYWTLNRQEMFRTQAIQAGDVLPIGTHYLLSLVLYMNLLLTPILVCLYDFRQVRFLHRLSAVGCSSVGAFWGAFTVAVLILLPAPLAVSWICAGGLSWQLLLSAGLCALCCAALSTVICLLCSNASGSSLLAFVLSTVFLALAGGILPPVLMGQQGRAWMAFSPITHMRRLLAVSAGQPFYPGSAAVVGGLSILLLILAAYCFKLRLNREVAEA